MTDSGGSPSWSFHNPTRIRFGTGSRAILTEELKGMRLLAVSSARGRRQFEGDALTGVVAATFEWVDTVRANPGLAETQADIDRLSDHVFDAVVAIGGGSAMDAAKALAMALAPGQTYRDLGRLIREGGEALVAPLPVYALTTTAGTGAEVTPFATIWDYANRKKLSLFHPKLFPVLAVVDAELTYGLPDEATRSTGLDALSHAFESVWNKNRNPITIMMAARSIALGLEGLPRVVVDPEDRDARGMMAEASLLAGLCISHTRTALAHSISYPLTAHFGIDHGLACAYSLGPISRYVFDKAPDILSEVAVLAGFGDARSLVDALENVLRRLDVTMLLKNDLHDKDLAKLRSEMITPGRSDNFLLPVSEDLLDMVIGMA